MGMDMRKEKEDFSVEYYNPPFRHGKTCSIMRWSLLFGFIMLIFCYLIETQVNLWEFKFNQELVLQALKDSKSFAYQPLGGSSSNADEPQVELNTLVPPPPEQEEPISSWESQVVAIRIDENKENMENHDKVKADKGEEPMEGDLKSGWLEAANHRRTKYPAYHEGIDFSKKYVFYKLCNDYAAGLLHYGRSLTGMVREASKLNRVLVWLPMVLPSHHNRGIVEVKDPALFFDKEKIKEEFGVEIMDEAEFFGRYKRTILDGVVVTWGSVGIAGDVSTKDLVGRYETVLQRDYTGRWDRFIFSLNGDPDLKDMNKWISYAPHLENLANDILKELGEDYDAVHVRRGDKMRRKKQWPHLENDTSPEALLEKIPKYVKPGRTLYISSDESKEGFFDPLKDIYNVKMAKDFQHLWAKGSEWYKASIKIAGEIPAPTFDNFQQGYVDYTIADKAKFKVETFRHLATDPWGGL